MPAPDLVRQTEIGEIGDIVDGDLVVEFEPLDVLGAFRPTKIGAT